MTGWSLLHAALRASSRAGQRAEQQPAPGGPDSSGWVAIAVAVVLMPVAVTVVVSGYEGQVSGLAVAAYILLAAGLVTVLGLAGRLAVRGLGRAVVRRYAELPGEPSPAEGWRETAARLRAADAAGAEVLTVRERRALACTAVLCPVKRCRATAGVTCTAVAEHPVVVLHDDPVLLCHPERMRDSVKYGIAIPSDIRAQFDNDVPEGIL